MNFAQFGLFILYVFSILVSGVGIYNFINRNDKAAINRSIYLGETLLLGSILLVGELLILSLIGLYKAPYLWSAVLVNYTFLLNNAVRNNIYNLFARKISFDLPIIAVILLLLIFIFRNCYFLIDVDSLSTYLFTQKLWLSAGTCLIGDIGSDMRIFAPHFNAVPYSLGISIFGQETLFPQLIDLFWRLIVVFLVFGYTSYRFNRYYGLAATGLVILNDHFFYSGANQWIILNGALIAFLFASAYNFWEAKISGSNFRFTLALIFLSQLMANKFQMVFVLFFMLAMGFLIQPFPLKMLKEAFSNKRAILVLVFAAFITSFWFFKNFLMTGDPVFPVFAAKLGIFNWTLEQTRMLSKVFGPLTPMNFLKYMNYLFIWPGVNAAKYVIVTISFLPLFLVMTGIKSKIDKDLILELCYWLSLSILLIMGVCFVSWQDPRSIRYFLGILSFSAIFSLHYILKYCLNIKKEIFLYVLILIFAFMGSENEGYKVIYKIGEESGNFKRPNFKENMGVILNKIHMDYIIKKHRPNLAVILRGIEENREKLDESAWNVDSFGLSYPAFLLPVRPIVSVWLNALIRWDSYEEEEMVIRDLKQAGIKWIMKMEGGRLFHEERLVFVPIEKYAKEPLRYKRYPKTTFYNYNFPQELSEIKY